MRMIQYLFKQSWQRLSFAIVSGAVAGLSSAALITVITKGISDEPHEPWLAAAFFLLCALVVVSKSCSEIALLRVTQETIRDLRVSSSRKLLATPLKKLNEIGKEGVMLILTRDIDTFIGAFQLLPLAFSDAIVIVACLGYLAWLSWQLFALFLLMLVLSVLGFRHAERGPVEQLSALREFTDVLYGNFRSLIDGSRELQLNAQRGNFFVNQVIVPGVNSFKDMFVGSMSRYTLVLNVGMILFYLVLGALLFVAPHWLPLSTKTLAGTTLILLYLIRPISEMLFALPGLRQAAISLDKILELHDSLSDATPATEQPDPFAHTAPALLELRGVCHRYTTADSDRQFLLGPLDLQLRRGEIVFIVGGNGSGKTTLAMLLLGLYEAEAGAILLNGVALSAANNDHYRKRFSAVFADFHLFEHVGERIDPALSARASHYLQAFGIGHKTRVTDGKFSTIDLSTGQRKRLALISAYLEEREIYLFDEWAADQDPVFKRIFYTELLPELKAGGKTVLVISHDDAYFGGADRVIKLDDGKLSNAGSPRGTELLHVV